MAHRPSGEPPPAPDPAPASRPLPTDAAFDALRRGAAPARPPWLSTLVATASGPWVAVVVVAALVAGGAGAWIGAVALAPAHPAEDGPVGSTSAPAVTAPAGSSTTTPVATVTVHAAGAVLQPGVYELHAGARVADLVAAAGGLAPGAAADRLNLADPLVDGARLYVPTMEEPAPPPVVAPAGPSGAEGDGAAGGPVDLNRADAEALEELPGIGPTLAAAIVRHREEHGPFARVEDLLEVSGIGEARLAQLRDLVVVGP